MSKVVKCDGADCTVTIPISAYDSDGRDWIEVVDRLDTYNTRHYHSLPCLYTYTGGTYEAPDGTTTKFNGRVFSYRTWSS